MESENGALHIFFSFYQTHVRNNKKKKLFLLLCYMLSFSFSHNLLIPIDHRVGPYDLRMIIFRHFLTCHVSVQKNDYSSRRYGVHYEVSYFAAYL